MLALLQYFIGCIGFALALIGGAGCYATLEEFDFEQDELWDLAKPAGLLAVGLVLLYFGFPA